ncbi:hypothetical protein ACFXPZ_44020 [Streptomyces sp. NPDC059101]|uniref:hypothetical protein n=1 Tax=Streptomyces sp. NPDC059101 TaxID=3346728 RepID=UPI00367C28F2
MSVRRGGQPVLQVGAHVRFRDGTWQVIAVAGQQVHLAGETGGDETLVAGHLFADPSCAIVGAEMPQAVTQWGLFETVDRGDLAEPALFLGLLEPVEQVRVDLLQAGHLLGIGPQDGTADAGFSEL